MANLTSADLRPLLALLPALWWQPVSQASALVQEMAMHAMLESAASALTTLGDYSALNPDGIANGSHRIGAAGLRWSGSVGDAGWAYTGSGMLGGMALSMNLSGSVSGADGADITFTIVGSGMLGSQPLSMDGTSTWHYNSVLDDYFDSDFVEHTKIGANSWHGYGVNRRRTWCPKPGPENGTAVISDIIAGGSILQGWASSGKRIRHGGGMKYCYVPHPDDILVSVASSGKMGSLVSGAAAKSGLTPAPAAAPGLPAPIADFLDASNQGTLVQSSGGLYGDDVDNRYRSSGSFGGGTFSGVTHDVPAPATGGLVALAGVAAWAQRRRQAARPQAPAPPATTRLTTVPQEPPMLRVCTRRAPSI